ncbi:hypothetical protein WICMUC_002564 [Wickerhamomyces mucosus]|uniref:Uncharacterized protein n=1 Tax=Wickerhamomyces mucosus TaxID=1378264 RepID=A0A9P8PP10_9ASCO|nr:hypothetical protein WICMUC_002564 [Wickerhamomyces mucosus]
MHFVHVGFVEVVHVMNIPEVDDDDNPEEEDNTLEERDNILVVEEVDRIPEPDNSVEDDLEEHDLEDDNLEEEDPVNNLE